MYWSRKELTEVQDQINYGHEVEERLKGELKELEGTYSSLYWYNYCTGRVLGQC